MSRTTGEPPAAGTPPAAGEGWRVGDRQVAGLEALAEAIELLGYRQLYAAGIGDGLFAAHRPTTLAALEDWPAAERHALRLLALGVAAEAPSLPPALAGALGALSAAGLVHVEGSLVRSAGWVLVPALSGHLLTRLPPGYLEPGEGGGRAYLGPDSLRLAAALPPPAGRRVLDLGAGCGVQGLLAVPGAAAATLTDVEADSLRTAEWNRVLNRVAHPVRVLEGDLYAPVAGERFDLVVTLPPYVPTVPGAAQSDVTAGGADGLHLLRRVVAGAPDHLAPGGELVAVCQLLCRGDEPLLAEELPSLAPDLDARLVVHDWHPLQPYLLDLATELVAAGGGDVRTVLEEYRVSLRGFGVTGACTAVLRLRRPVTGERPDCRVVGGRPVGATDVVRRAEGVTLGADPSLRVVARPGAAPVVVEGPTAALLEALDGHRTLEDAAATAWGHLAGADRRDVADQAVRRAVRLQRQGLAEPVGDRSLAGPAGEG